MGRLVTGKRKFDPIADDFTELGWLFSKLLYKYKVLCMTYKIIHCNNVELFSDYYQNVNVTRRYPTSSSQSHNLSTTSEFKGK